MADSFDDFPQPGWNAWRAASLVTIRQAACLLSNEDPQAHTGSQLEKLPAQAQTMSHLIAYAILAGELVPYACFVRRGEEGFLPTNEVARHDVLGDSTTILTAELASWCNSKNLPHPWVLNAAARGSASHSAQNNYPLELRAAIGAFEAVRNDQNATAGQTPKQALLKWLRTNTNLGKEARERVAIVANWQPSGGAPRTPGG